MLQQKQLTGQRLKNNWYKEDNCLAAYTKKIV
jgi:hypothetical protein